MFNSSFQAKATSLKIDVFQRILSSYVKCYGCITTAHTQSEEDLKESKSEEIEENGQDDL
jgi:hypothetical protein